MAALANVAHQGVVGKASIFSTNSKNRTWINDTGASDHITKDLGQLNYFLSSHHSLISIANGSTFLVTGEGYVILSDKLPLDIILVVMSLKYNLLSVSQITSTLSCIVTLCPSYCVFLDILTKIILCYGVKRGKLYYLGFDRK